MMIKKLLLSVLCIACCAQPVSIDAFSSRWMRRTFSSRSAKIWGAVGACVAVGLVGYAYMDQNRENNPEKNPLLNLSRRNSIIGLSDSEDNDVENDIEEPEVILPKNIRTPLINAIINGDLNQVRQLIGGGADINQPDSNGKTPFMCAIQHYDRRTFGLIWNRKPNLDAQDNAGKNWMMYAIDHDLPQRPLASILRVTQNVNAVDGNGQTPIMYAARTNKHTLFSDLLNRGCSLDTQDTNDKTALHYAIENTSHNAVEALLDYNEAPINLADNELKTPLIRSLINGHNGFAEQLLNRDDIQVNHMDTNNHSALYYAVQMNRPEMVELIVQKNPHISDAALNLAFDNNNQQIIDAVNGERIRQNTEQE